jgi:alanine racemase
MIDERMRNYKGVVARDTWCPFLNRVCMDYCAAYWKDDNRTVCLRLELKGEYLWKIV